jgi:hypothetical protein
MKDETTLDSYEPPRIDPLGSFSELTTGTASEPISDSGSISGS